MELNTISIAEFIKEELKDANFFSDDLLVTNNIAHAEQFKYPCRINAITFLICLSGDIDCSVNLKDYDVRANGVLVSFPENIIRIDNTRDFDGYVLLISSSYLENLHVDIRQKLVSYMSLKENPLTAVSRDDMICLSHYCQLIKEALGTKCKESKDIISGLIQSFIFKIISIINICQSSIDISSTAKSNVQQYFEKFMTLLSTYHTRERSVKFYASRMNLTGNYLSGLVKSYSGKSASEWIIEYVILEAKALLKFSGLNIQQVAYELNFPSQSMFGKYFKKQTGMSPKVYIKS